MTVFSSQSFLTCGIQLCFKVMGEVDLHYSGECLVAERKVCVDKHLDRLNYRQENDLGLECLIADVHARVD